LKAVVYPKALSYMIKDIPEPELKPDEVLIKVMSCGVCRSDEHVFKGEYFNVFPIVPGHEFAGIIDKVGSAAEGFHIGDRVTADNTINCGHCYYCRRNQPLYCENFQALGCSRNGGFAQYVAVNYGKVYPIADHLKFDEACFAEPLASTIHGMDRINLRCGDEVLIFGAGPTGILLTQLVKNGGASNVVVCASSQSKLDFIKEHHYAKTVLMDRNDYDRHTREILNRWPNGFDVVIDATGAAPVIKQCARFAHKGAKLILYGVPSGAEISVNPLEIFNKELSVICSDAQTLCFDRSVRFLNEGIIRTDGMATNFFYLDDFGKALDMLLHRKDFIKIVVHPNGE